jgi:hypothetical protein
METKGKIITFNDLAHFSNKQWEALYASEKFKFTLYGGSMGSGKSYWLRWACIWWLLKLAGETKLPGIRAGLFCEDYGALNDRHISKMKTEFPQDLGTYNEQRHEFQLHERFGSGIIAFRNLDDPSKYLSSEFAVVAVDELIKNAKSTFDILRTRMRWVGIPNPRFISATNPGEGWVKQYFIEKNFPPSEQEGKEFCYIAALPKDNPYLPKEYFTSLESLPEAERKAYLEGDWSAFERNMDDEGFYPLLSSSEISNAYIDNPIHVGNSVLGIDPAAGGDKSSIVLKSEMCQQILFNQKTKDIMSMVPVVVGISQTYGSIKMAMIDRTGVGEGLFRRLKELESKLGFKVRGVAYAEGASQKDIFENMKAELYWKERDWILHGGKLLRDDGWNEFSTVKFKRTSDNKVKIQSKDELRRRGFKSPNCVDAAVLTMLAPKKFDSASHGWSDVIDRRWRGQ